MGNSIHVTEFHLEQYEQSVRLPNFSMPSGLKGLAKGNWGRAKKFSRRNFPNPPRVTIDFRMENPTKFR
jgi:hypothetical protein